MQRLIGLKALKNTRTKSFRLQNQSNDQKIDYFASYTQSRYSEEIDNFLQNGDINAWNQQEQQMKRPLLDKNKILNKRFSLTSRVQKNKIPFSRNNSNRNYSRSVNSFNKKQRKSISLNKPIIRPQSAKIPFRYDQLFQFIRTRVENKKKNQEKQKKSKNKKKFGEIDKEQYSSHRVQIPEVAQKKISQKVFVKKQKYDFDKNASMFEDSKIKIIKNLKHNENETNSIFNICHKFRKNINLHNDVQLQLSPQRKKQRTKAFKLFSHCKLKNN